MSAAAVCRVIGGVLVVLISAALATGGVQLWRRGPAGWPEMIANAIDAKRISHGMMAMAAALLAAGIAVIGNARWGGPIAAILIIIATAAAFWVHYTLFGDIRAWKTGTNVVVAGIILALLWVGYGGDAR